MVRQIADQAKDLFKPSMTARENVMLVEAESLVHVRHGNCMDMFFQKVYHTEAKDLFKSLITVHINCGAY